MNTVPQRIVDTICSRNWLGQNEEQIKALFPEHWTHPENIDVLKIGFGLKCLGVDWRETQELIMVMARLGSEGFYTISADGLLRRNRHPIYEFCFVA